MHHFSTDPIPSHETSAMFDRYDITDNKDKALCSRCWEAERVAIHLTDIGAGMSRCPKCGQVHHPQRRA